MADDVAGVVALPHATAANAAQTSVINRVEDFGSSIAAPGGLSRNDRFQVHGPPDIGQPKPPLEP